MSIAFKIDSGTGLWTVVNTETFQVLGRSTSAQAALAHAKRKKNISQEEFETLTPVAELAQSRESELANSPRRTVTLADLDPANRQIPPANAEQAQVNEAASTASNTIQDPWSTEPGFAPAVTPLTAEENSLLGGRVTGRINDDSVLGGLEPGDFTRIVNTPDPILGGVPVTPIGQDDVLGGLAPGDFTQRITDEKPKNVATVSQQREIDTSKPRPNPLDDYASYTYNLSLHVIPIEKYNRIVSTPGIQYRNDDNTVLVASAGRRDNTNFRRDPEFNEDFYFENLKFTTVIGLNSRSRNTNAIDMSFTLVEPYGVTFLNRLLKVADRQKAKSWMQIPFMLQIDFMGSDDQGKLYTPIRNQTKYIPIKIIGIKIKVTPKGSEYAITAIPFNHQAYSEVNSSTPAFLEVQATTLGDFFSSTGSAGEASKILEIKKLLKEREDAEVREATEFESNRQIKDAAEQGVRKRYQEIRSAISSSAYVVGSYTAALNSYQQQLKANKHVRNEEIYEFVFTDPAMRESKIVVPKKTAPSRTPMAKPTTAEGVAAIRSQAGLSTAKLDNNTETFTINAGTNIIDVINLVVRQSDYIRNQFVDPATEVPANGQKAADSLKKPINWYKVVPVIELREFDIRTEKYSKKITYYIVPYKYYNSKFRDAPKALPTYYCKEYQYIYTGKNKHILNFDIDFDTMFYTAITADRSKIQSTSTQQLPEQDQDHNGSESSKRARIQDNVTHPVAGQADMPNSASPDSKGVLVADFSKSMMSSSRGDMISVSLKIIGDPELIKQDDIFYNPANNPDYMKNDIIDPKTNSVMFDAAEQFALLQFKTPVDYDDRTGLMKFEKFETSSFSGLYKIIVVENVFEKGQFTQTLKLVRMFDQPLYDRVDGANSGNKSSTENRTPDPTNIAGSLTPSTDLFVNSDEFSIPTDPFETTVAQLLPDDTSDFGVGADAFGVRDEDLLQDTFDLREGDSPFDLGIDSETDLENIEIPDELLDSNGLSDDIIGGADEKENTLADFNLPNIDINNAVADFPDVDTNNTFNNSMLITRLRNQLRDAPTLNINDNLDSEIV